MMTLRHQWICGIIACLSQSSAAAQSCTGAAPFTAGAFQAGAGATFNDNARTFGGGLAYGGTGAFGQVGVATTTYDDFDGSTLSVSGGAGYQVRLDERDFAHLCPTAGVSFGSGPNDLDLFGDGSVVIDLSETDIVVGLSVGIIATRSGTTQIVPNASLSYVSATVKVKDQVSGTSDSDSEAFGRLGLGIGFILSRTVTLEPRITIPFGLEGGSTAFSAGVAVSFGKPAK